MEKINNSYIQTAIKWAVRNEVRRRWRWYSSKLNRTEQNKMLNQEDETGELVLREAVYKTILSIDEIQEHENSSIISDNENNPEQSILLREMAKTIRESMCTLTQREKELIESRFYKNKKLKDISDEFNISQSRISRIIQTALNKIKVELLSKNIL